MSSESGSTRGFAGAMILFILCSVISILLLISTLVVWLFELIGSLELAMLIFGLLLGVIAAIIYIFSLRDSFRQITIRLEMIYDTARLAHEGYRWLERLLLKWLERV